MQEALQRRKQELEQLEINMNEARATLDSHDQAVSVRASDLEVLAGQMEAAEQEVQRQREEAQNEADSAKAQLAEVQESRRLVAQVCSAMPSAESTNFISHFRNSRTSYILYVLTVVAQVAQYCLTSL